MTAVRFHGFALELDPQVYGPAEDTELLLEALGRLDVEQGDRAGDVGTGTGAVALSLARRGAEVVATDVNPRAAALARANARRNGLADRVAVLRASLLAPVRGPLDVVAFNPPYLPVEGEVPGDLARAWEGGPGGIAWAPLFLAGLRRCLAPGGRALVLLSSAAARGVFVALAAERGFAANPVARAKLPWETLEAFLLERAGPNL